jgi:enoyl-CoA hydratase/carnithine racemase
VTSAPQTDTHDSPHVRYDVREGVATITFDKPDKLNAVDRRMHNRYYDLLAEADQDPGVRAIVVTGAGRAFCAGAEREQVTELEGGGAAALASRPRPIHFPALLSTPVVAAVNGPAVGIGLSYAAYADVRIASEDAYFCAIFPRLGLVAEQGLAWLLPRLCGQGNALDILLSGRRVGAVEAQAMGLVQRVADGDVLASAREYAGALAARCSPRSMSTIRRQVREAWASSLEEAANAAELLTQEALRSPDLSEALVAMRERRVPQFPALGGPPPGG